MVRLTIIPAELVLSQGSDNLPNPALRVVREEIRQLSRGSPREAEVMKWLDGWTAETEAAALLAELKAERAKRQLPAQPIEEAAKSTRQSNKLLVERTEAEIEEAQRQRQQEEFARRAQIANETAVELGYFQRQMEALAARRYDPTGNWGPPNYRTGREDW